MLTTLGWQFWQVSQSTTLIQPKIPQQDRVEIFIPNSSWLWTRSASKPADLCYTHTYFTASFQIWTAYKLCRLRSEQCYWTSQSWARSGSVLAPLGQMTTKKNPHLFCSWPDAGPELKTGSEPILARCTKGYRPGSVLQTWPRTFGGWWFLLPGMLLRGWIRITLKSPDFSSRATIRLKFVVLTEIPAVQWHFVQTCLPHSELF